MTFSTAGVLADAWVLWRRDRNLLIRIGAPFLFLPDYAMKLLLPPPVPSDAGQASLLVAIEAQGQFVGAHLPAYLAQLALFQFGLAALFAAYTAPAEVRTILRQAFVRWPRIMLASLLVGVPGTIGLLLVLPGLMIFGRTVLAAPVLMNEQPVSAVGAIIRSLHLTRGTTLTVTGLAAIGFLLRFAPWPFDQLDLWLRGLHAPNPVPLAVIDGASAAASALAELAAILIAVAAYRSLVGRTSKGM